MSIETDNFLDELRVETQEFLNEQRLTAARVVTVEKNTRPAQLLSFDYYGTDDRVQDIIDLNKDQNIPYYQGAIEVLTSDNG